VLRDGIEPISDSSVPLRMGLRGPGGVVRGGGYPWLGSRSEPGSSKGSVISGNVVNALSGVTVVKEGGLWTGPVAEK
jgi:hypothetical protein